MGAYEQQLGMVQTPQKISKPKTYKYKVTSSYSSDRNTLAQIILQTDPEAKIIFGDDWNFKVKTKLTYSELSMLLVYAEFTHCLRPKLGKIRKIWLF